MTLKEESDEHPFIAAEGATAPETLRQKDFKVRSLWKAGIRFSLTEGVSQS